MLLDPAFVVQNPLLVLGAVGGVMLLEVGVTALSVRVIGESVPVAAAAGLTLAQVGEFSFVLERAGCEAGLSPAGLGEAGGQTFVAATVVLMVLTPFLAQAGSAVQARLLGRQGASGGEVDLPLPEGQPTLRDHVVLGGYGDAARRLTTRLRDRGVPHLVLTLSPEGAREAETAGTPVLRGDYTRRHILDLAGVDRARMLLVADDEPGLAHRVVAVARSMNPLLPIVVRVRREAEAVHFRSVGADVVSEELASVVQLAEHALGEPPGAARDLSLPGDRTAMVTLSEQQLHSPACDHADAVHPVEPSAPGCEECLRTGDGWVHLRVCMSCGHVGCCDSSPNKHATKHYHATAHPIVKSYEPGEDWAWCYADATLL